MHLFQSKPKRRIRGINLFASFLIGCLLLFSGCLSNSEGKLENIDFSYVTYYKSSEGVDAMPFDPEMYQLTGKSMIVFFRGTVWCKVRLENNSESDQSLIIYFTDKLNQTHSLHKEESLVGMRFDSVRTNVTVYRDCRSYPSVTPNFEVEIPKDSVRFVYLCASSDGRVIEIRPSVILLEDYISLIRKSSFINAFFFGSLFLILLVNLFFWRIFRNSIHVYYSLYLLFTILLFFGFEGYYYGWGISGHIVDHFIFLFLKGLLLSFLFFTSKFLKLKEIFPLIFKWIKGTFFLVYSAVIVYQFIFFYSSIRHLHFVENITSICLLTFLLILILISYPKKKREVQYYVLALLFYLFFTILGETINYAISFDFEFNFFFKIGTSIEVIIFTYTIIKVAGLSERKHLEEKFIIVEKNRITALENKNLKAKLQDSNMQKMEFLAVLKLIESNLSCSDDWESFKQKVNELNPSFLNKLKQDFPKLSKNDLRLLLLVKIGFSQKEIANMLFIAESSVKKSRQRVRKKMGITNEINLSEFLDDY